MRGDTKLRELERLASQGDVQAIGMLHLERYRRGLPLLPDAFDRIEDAFDRIEDIEPWFFFLNGFNVTGFPVFDDVPAYIVLQQYDIVRVKDGFVTGFDGFSRLPDRYSHYVNLEQPVEEWWFHPKVQERLAEFMLSDRSGPA